MSDLKQRKSVDAVNNTSATQDKTKAGEAVSAMASFAVPPWLTNFAEKAAPHVSKMNELLQTALPYISEACKFASEKYNNMHPNLLKAIFGLIICFFGGFFPTLIAAYEAVSQTGWQETKAAFKDIWGELEKVSAKSAEDDKKDDDGDGVADVTKLKPQELALRKTALALKHIDADKFNKAMSGLYTSSIAVAAVLKVQFARTIALAVSIGDCIIPVALSVVLKETVGDDAEKKSFKYQEKSWVLKPGLDMIPQEYHQWVPIIIGYVCKSIAMSIAWYIQMVLSAFHSAIRGGLMCSRGLMKYAHKQGLDKEYLKTWYPDGLDHKETMLDEFVGWGLAALGFLFQISFGFHLPFPFNIVLFPLTVTEHSIRWMITN